MKKIALLIGIFIICLSACKNENETNPELERLNAEYKILQEQANSKDSSINSFLQGLNEIEENLATIKERENLLTVNTKTSELQKTKQEQIVEDIQKINELLIENKQKMEKLQGKLKTFGPQISELEKMMARVNEQIEKKDQEIILLKNQLATINTNYKTLFDEYNLRIEEVAQQQGELNTAYYAYGTSKELKENGIITKEGGFVGIGASKKLKSDFNRSYFTKVDITETLFIDIISKKPLIVTSHPVGSYVIEGAEKNHRLTIKDPKEFWSVSKYLVIITD